MENKQNGFFGIGICNGKIEENVGMLWRSAHLLGASFIFTIGDRYKKQPTDTAKSYRHIPLYNYKDFADLLSHLPLDCHLVGIELHKDSEQIMEYSHPKRAVYLLGAEDGGLSEEILEHCQHLVQLPGEFSMNVAVAGSIVMYDRIAKAK